MDAIILAGGRLEGEFAEATGTTVKALLAPAGETLLERAVRAARESSHITRVAVGGPPEIEEIARRAGADVCTPGGASAIDTALNAARAMNATGMLYLGATDLPYVTAADVDHLIEQMPDTPAVGYAVVEKGPFDAAFADHSKRFIPLADGHFRSGGAAMIHASLLERLEPLLQAAFAGRKSMGRLAALVGFRVFLRFLLSQWFGPRIAPSTEDLRRRIEHILGCPGVILRGTPGIGFDVDKLSDWEYVRRQAGISPASGP
jgi:GTP:adenosylcobinamide-phosphate guanylyltransferase